MDVLKCIYKGVSSCLVLVVKWKPVWYSYYHYCWLKSFTSLWWIKPTNGGQTQPTSSSPGGTKSNAWSSVVPADWQGRFRQWQQWASQMFEGGRTHRPSCHKFVLRRKPGGPAPRWTQMPRKSTDSQKRFLIGAFEWMRISGCWYCWHKMRLSNSDIAGQTFFFVQGRLICFTELLLHWDSLFQLEHDEDV